MIDGAFDRLAKWWRFAVDRFELKGQEKILDPKNDFPKFAFLGLKIFCVKKLTNIQIVTHPYLGRLSKNVLEVFHDDIVNLARGRKWVFFIWDPKIDWFPVGPFGLTFVKNDWWGVWPSCQMMKICCWPIWAPKSGKSLDPKNDFPKFAFLTVKFFCANKITNIQIVTHPYLGRLSKNALEVLHDDIANLARGRKCIFSIWDPKIDWFPVGPFGLTFVKNDWWGVWPSCQMMKKCCWPIWAPKSGKNFRPRKRFSQICVFGP